MLTRTALKLIRLALIVATLLFAIEPGFAQKKPVPSGPNNAYLKMRKMTIAERQAAAKRNAQRKAATGQRNQVAPPKSEVKK